MSITQYGLEGDTMRKWTKIRRSKWKFPTKIIKGSTGHKGQLVIGEKLALTDIERQIGGKLNFAKTMHTPTQWVFCIPIGGNKRT